jgi:4-hydroxy 2-oxovalerate aldolase
MGNALANSMRAVAEGVTWIDGTVTGMGRGPGNAKTEYLAITLAPYRTDSGDITPVLALAARRFKPMQDAFGWGSNPFYYLAGKYAIHPTYVQEMLADARNSEEDILAAIDRLRSIGGKKFDANTLEGARHFFRGDAHGTWSPASLIAGREVLVLGSGPGIAAHRKAIEDYIRVKKPFVLALNTQTNIAPEMIDVRAACHPVRLLSDSGAYAHLSQPLITPASMLPESLLESLGKTRLLDFGITVTPDTFHFGDTHCVIPTSMVFAYALAAATSGKATRILLAGFDGYGADDPRTAEMNSILRTYQRANGALPLLSITPTRYTMPATSVYALA